MKKFVFTFATTSGRTITTEIFASNQGVAIALFKKRSDVEKILKIEKEKTTNGKNNE